MPCKPKPLPHRWFLTDSRIAGEMAVIRALPADVGVIVRLPHPARQKDAARRLINACRRRKLVVLLAAPIKLALAHRADGAHLSEAAAKRGHRHRPHHRFRLTAAAHSLPALRRAERLGVDAAFLSPVFPTASHPGARTLGVARFAVLRRKVRIPVFALGGVNQRTRKRLAAWRADGWGAIDAWAKPGSR